MIAEILIQRVDDGRTQVTVYPNRFPNETEGRTYYDPSESSRKRLERMMREHNVRPYLRKRGLSIWIAR